MFCSHLAACGCVLAPVSGWGPPGSPGRGELLRLSRLGELLLVETSLLLQLLVAEEEEALDTTNPGERQPYPTGGGDTGQSEPRRLCLGFLLKTHQILIHDCKQQLLLPSQPWLEVFKSLRDEGGLKTKYGLST